MAKPSNPFSRYQRVDGSIKPRIIANSIGEVGTGKTTWWLGAPAPILVQTLDDGLEGVVEPFAREKEIYVASYDLGKEPGAEYTHALAVEARNKFVEDYEHAITNGIRTIVWDRESDMWPMFSYAEHGTDDMFAAAPPKDWEKLKGKIRRLIAMAKASDINLGIIQGMKNEWASKVNPRTGAKAAAQTGGRVPSGMEEIDALVHIVIEHGKDPFSLTISKCRGPGGMDLQGQTLENLTFSQFAQLVFPETTEEDWV